VPLPNWIGVDTIPNIYHLVELKESYHRYVVMIVTEETVRILQVNLGEVTAQLWEQRPDLRKRVGREWTKTHYQKHQRERKRRFYKDAIKVVDDLVSAGDYSHFILAGHTSVTSQVEKELPKRLSEKLIDTVPLSSKTPLGDVIDATLASFIRAEEAESQAILDNLLYQHRTGGLAAVGTADCIRAMQHGQADILLLAKEYQGEDASLCVHCGAVDLGSSPPTTCRQCGEHKLQQIDVREQMARWAEQHGCPVDVVEQSAALVDLGGVGCLLSYRLPSEYS
jgi:peptide subunit release factor 1 (eRF1)